jgi:hypothetical protein
MKKISILIVCMLFSMIAFCQDTLLMYHSGNVIYQNNISNIDSLKLGNSTSNLLINTSGNQTSFPISGIDSIVFASQGTNTTSNIVYVIYNGDTATVINPITDTNFLVSVSGANVSITTTAGISNIEYHLSGTSSDGSFLLNSDKKFSLTLGGLSLTSLTTTPIKLSKNKDVTITIANNTTNTLTDNANGDGKAIINSKGNTTITGSGTLVCNALKKNGISSDNDIVINGGNITINNSTNVSKSLKSDADIEIHGGTITLNPTGSMSFDTLTLGYDPSYCSGVSCVNALIDGGTLNITIPSTNSGGKGISVDSNVTINGGTIHITSAGGGTTYIDSTGTTDSYSSACIKADHNIYLYQGTITCSATGVGGKGISADTNIYIGVLGANDSLLHLNVSTSGARFYVSGSGENADYANSKAIKSVGNLYLNSGTLVITTTTEGGEGIESKDTLFINGGNTDINTYDDGINASNHIQINGGKTHSHATNNDGIDSNGTLTVTGGITIANGTSAPEEGFDCDQNVFTITGGILIGTGGSTSTPSSSTCTQHAIVYSGASNGSAIHITNSNGDDILTYQLPTLSSQGGGQGGPGGGPGGNNGITLLFSSSSLASGSYTLKYGGTISGGTEYNGYYTNSTYSGGTSKTFTISSSMVTNVQ